MIKSVQLKFYMICGMMLVSGLLAGCANESAQSQPGSGQASFSTAVSPTEESTADNGDNSGLVWQEREALRYAEGFTIDCYKGGYRLLTLRDGEQILTVPEGKAVPEGAGAGVVVLQQPVDRVYLLASASMDMFAAMDALDRIAFCGTEADGWYIPEAKAAMEAGNITYAGKYSAPDYEMLLQNGCRLAIVNTMITHTPEVADKMEELGIPVIVDYASYEKSPLGRMEWVKFYGALCGCEEKAEAVFEEQVKNAGNYADTGKTVAFFYILNDGVAVVRRSDDYVPEMIRLAGGQYILQGLSGENHLSTENMQMEEFYARAKDADYIVYNGTTAGEIQSVQELLGKSELMSEFKAVKEGHVYAVSKNLYQSTMSLGTVIADFHEMLTDGAEEKLVYLKKLE